MRLSCIERPQSIPGNHSHSCTENWFSDMKDFDQKGDPAAIFNVLDSILKSSLDRLASLRFIFSPVTYGLYLWQLYFANCF